MSNYTLQLRRLHEAPNVQVFTFNYDFYTDDPTIKKNFEQKFIDHYYFDEIGFETIGMFKHRLRTTLNNIMPMIRKRYETELASRDINFLLNKDLTETTTRDLNKQDQATNTNNANSTNNSETNANENSLFRESNLSNGNATLDLNSLTSTNANETTMHNGTVNTTNAQSSINSNSNGKEQESITLVSRGNIGITSSAELLEKWREVLIDVDQEIIHECRNLFMKIY